MSPQQTTRVLIGGGGVAALEAALALRALAGDRVSVELIAPEPRFWYRPLAVAEPFQLGAVRHFDLARLAADAGATFTLGALTAVDADKRVGHTSAGSAIPYDALLIACGTVRKTAVPGALTFRGPADTDSIRQLLRELESGTVGRVAFAVPWGAVWSLPLYELALMTAEWIGERGITDVELTLVTPEEQPLQVFGHAASAAVGALLDARGVKVVGGAYPVEFRDGVLRLVPQGAVAADRVVALPRLHGQRIDGVPQTLEGFIPVDLHGRVLGLSDLYAAGDITNFPIKQGGVATQQADAAAEAIAAAAGVELDPAPFRPILRGLLLTGAEPRFLRRELADVSESTSLTSSEPLWWPPAKIVGRHLSPFLAGIVGGEAPSDLPNVTGAVRVEVDLLAEDLGHLTPSRLDFAARESARMGETKGTLADVLLADPLVVAPEDTLGEVAERMRERDCGSALVTDHGRLVGILTSRDLLRAFAGRVHSSEARARDWMTADPIAVPPGTSLESAAILMTEHGIHHLPVVEDDRPVGMVGMRDVVRTSVSLAGGHTGVGLGF